jgi:hypothetical protein
MSRCRWTRRSLTGCLTRDVTLRNWFATMTGFRRRVRPRSGGSCMRVTRSPSAGGGLRVGGARPGLRSGFRSRPVAALRPFRQRADGRLPRGGVLPSSEAVAQSRLAASVLCLFTTATDLCLVLPLDTAVRGTPDALAGTSDWRFLYRPWFVQQHRREAAVSTCAPARRPEQACRVGWAHDRNCANAEAPLNGT